MRVHKIANVGKALSFIASKGVKLAGIGAEGEEGRRERGGGRNFNGFDLLECVRFLRYQLDSAGMLLQ